MDPEEEYLDEEAIAKRKRREQRPDRKITVHTTDLPSNLQSEIIEICQTALDEDPNGVQKNVAAFVKARLDKDLGGTWHVIVGKHFGGNVTSDAQTMINFEIDNQWYLLFRSGPPEKPKAPKKDDQK